MGSVKRAIGGILSTLALIALILILITWVFFFASKPELLGNIKNIVGPIFEFISLGAIGAFITKSFKKHLKQTQNISSALVRVIDGEWVIQLCIWALLLVTSAYFIYTMPLYKVVTKVTQSTSIGDTQLRPPDLSLHLDGKRYRLSLISTDTSGFYYESDLILRWGDAGNVIKETQMANYIAADTVSIPWELSGFVRNLLNGIKVDFDQNSLELRINISPQSANASTRIATPFDTSSWSKLYVYTIERGMPFTVSTMADSYYSSDSSFIEGLVENTTINVTLTPKRGAVTFRTFNEGQQKIDSLRVYIDGEYNHERSWQKIWLTPGEYNIYMEKEYSPDEKLVVDTFQVRIYPERDTAVTCLVNIKRI